MRVSLVLLNANVITMDPAGPRAEAVAVVGERVAAVGGNGEIRRMGSRGARVVDCQGLTLLPGFNDAHCHLLGLGRRLQDLDCSPDALLRMGGASMGSLMALVRGRARGLRAGAWVRGYGYDDAGMAEGRHPVRGELDWAAPDNPVWLEHRSGHAAALNSRALALAGVGRETEEPPGGVIERDGESGEPTGVLLELRDFLRRRLGNIRSRDDFDAGMRAAGELLGSYGITSAQDAGADNGLERWDVFRRLLGEGVLGCRVTMFAGAGRLDEFAAAGMAFGWGEGRLRLGHAKVMLTMTGGALYPPAGELAGLVAGAHRRGFPAAAHCVEGEAIGAAVGVLGGGGGRPHPNPPPEGEGIMGDSIGGVGVGVADRIEHCAEAPPLLVDAVRRSGAAVVTQPGFVYHNGAAYRDRVAGWLLPHLYPVGGLHRAGVLVAFGSDAPVIDPNPWPAIYSAVTGCAGDGEGLGGGDAGRRRAVGLGAALRMYTAAGALAEGMGGDKGVIARGMLADMVLVDGDPFVVGAGGLAGVRGVMTVVGGAVVWRG